MNGGDDQWGRYRRVYKSASLYGADRIIASYLGLPVGEALPLTVPHGVDVYMNTFDLDLDTPEPIYLAWREDIARRVSATKTVLMFPHPWLLMRPAESAPEPAGTLLIAPPPSVDVFERFVRAIVESDLPRPWSVLLKDRGLTAADVEWWRSRGVATRTAGPIDHPEFYYNLRDALLGSAVIASANMSSAVVFGVAAGCRAVAIPDVQLRVLDLPQENAGLNLRDPDGLVRQTWGRLLAGDPDVALAQADELLGRRFLDTPERLRARYEQALSAADRRLHLPPLRGVARRSAETLIGWGLPLHRAFPNPLGKVRARVERVLNRDRLAVITGSDFSHFGVAGSSGPLRVDILRRSTLGQGAQPGFAARAEPSDGPPAT